MLPLLRMRWSDIRRSATFRLTTLLGCVFLVAVVALLSLTYVLTEKELVARNDQVVYKEARRLAAVPRGRMTAAVDAAIANNASGLNYFGLIGSNGQVLAGNMPQVPQLLPGEPFEIPAGAGVPVPLRVYVLPLADGCRLVVARDNTTLADLRDRVLAITVGSGLLVAVSAAVVGFWLSLGMLKRIGRMTDTAQHIARGELGQRMPVAGRHDELDLIATTVNAMMEEIERLLQQVKGATDAIAHDLRTPLAHLRHRLQGLSEREETASPIVERAVEELDLVLSRFTALLRISELEVAGRRAGFGLLDPMAVVAEVCELY
ncbi:MAG TPA: HAMP domain-containing protein, partial [Novosphingobium sp.]|nr:HAMP domain-containing protein [Novosphingobium sp.]